MISEAFFDTRVRVPKWEYEYRLRCTHLKDVQSEPCGETAHIVPDSFYTLIGWSGRAYCDGHDPRPAHLTPIIDRDPGDENDCEAKQ